MGYSKWEVRISKGTVFKGQAALTCFEVWAGERRIATMINEANAHRIVDCVNGCKDIENPLAVKDLYEALKAIKEMNIMNEGSDGKTCPHPKEFIATYTFGTKIPPEWEMVKKALAKAKSK